MIDITFTSRDGQDQWVIGILNAKTNGYFVDIGAHSGIQDSNTYILETYYGWTGICVEPHSISFKALKENRTCHCDSRCIWDTNTEVPFVQRGRRRQASGILHGNASESIINVVANKNHPIRLKQSTTLAELLGVYNAPMHIDYLSIDTEGSEWEILRNFDFNRYSFSLLTIEHNCSPKQNAPQRYLTKRDRIRSLLESNGYILSKSFEADDYFEAG